MPARWSMCPSYAQAPPSISNPSPANMRMRSAHWGFTSSAATSTASPVGRRRRISPVNTTAASRTLRPLCACTLRPGYGFGTDLLQHRRGHGSQDVEKRCSRVASRNQLCTGRGAHRCLWTRRGMCVGHRRWRNRALNHFRTPVSMANESVVAWKARTRRRALPERHRHRVRPWYQPGWYPRGRGRGTRGRFRAMGSGEIVLGCRSHQSVEKGVCHFLTGHSGVPGYEGASIHRPLSRALLVRAIDRRGRFEPIHLHSVLGAASLQSQCEGCFFRPAPRPSGRPHAVAEATPSPHESRCLRTSMGGVLATVPS